MMRSRVWAVDYRMPPDHPYPVPVDDCVTAYRALLDRRPPESIIIGGASAGGNIAPAAVLKARDLVLTKAPMGSPPLRRVALTCEVLKRG